MQKAHPVVAREHEQKDLRVLLRGRLLTSVEVVAIDPQRGRSRRTGRNQPLLQQGPPRRLPTPLHHPKQ